MSLDDRITPKTAPPPPPPAPGARRPERLLPQQAPRDAVPVAGHTALTVQPGQKLIVAVADTLADNATTISTTLQNLLPGVEVIVLEIGRAHV